KLKLINTFLSVLANWPNNLAPFKGPETIVARIGLTSSLLMPVSNTANITVPALMLCDGFLEGGGEPGVVGLSSFFASASSLVFSPSTKAWVGGGFQEANNSVAWLDILS